MDMNFAQMETNLQKLMKSFEKRTFNYELLLAYGVPKASNTRLQKGNRMAASPASPTDTSMQIAMS